MKKLLIKSKGKVAVGALLVSGLILTGIGFAVYGLPLVFGQTSEPTTKLSITNVNSWSWFFSSHYGVAGLTVKGSQSKKSYPKCVFSSSKSSCQYDVAVNKEINLAAIPKSKSDKAAWTGCDKTFSIKRGARDKILPGRTIYGCKTTASSGSEKKITVKFGS